MPVVYDQKTWKDRQVQYPGRYDETEVGGSIQHTRNPGVVIEKGTEYSAQNMNRIEKGIADCAAAVNKKCGQWAFAATIPATGWGGSAAAGYVRSINVSGMLATDAPIIGPNMEGKDLDEMQEIDTAWGCVLRIAAGSGKITVTAEEIPAVSIPIKGRCFRDE